MHRHDPDLIASVAEDLLVGDLAAQAAAEIASCPECSAELAAQRAALFALRGMAAPELTGAESSRMRAAVAEAVGLTPAVEPEPATRRRRSPWGAIALAAASLAGIVAVLPMLGIVDLGGGGDDADSVAAVEMTDAPAQTRDAATDATVNEELALTAPAPGEDGAPESAGGTLEEGETIPTTTEASATTTAPPEAAELRLPDSLEGEKAVEEFFQAGGIIGYSAEDGTGRTAPACTAAAEEHLGAGFVYLDIPVTLQDGREAVLFAGPGREELVAFDLEDCRPLLSLP